MARKAAEIMRYRWVIEAIIVTMWIVRFLVVSGIYPLLPLIIKDLNVSLATVGLVAGIPSLFTALSSLLAGSLAVRMDLKKLGILGGSVFFAGALLTANAPNHWIMTLARVILGLGGGILSPVELASVMAWFPKNERPTINSINSSLLYVGLSLSYLISVPLSMMMGWRGTLMVYAGGAGLILLLILTLYRNAPKLPTATIKRRKTFKGKATWGEVFRMKETWLVNLAGIGSFWSFPVFSAYITLFLVGDRGLTLEAASTLTTVFGIAGFIGVLSLGFLTAKVGLRKPFLWPPQILRGLGLYCVLILDPANPLYILCFIAAGLFGAIGGLMHTVLMELPGVTVEKYVLLSTQFMSVTLLTSFVGPFIAGWIAESMGVHMAILSAVLANAITIVSLFLLPETGPRGKKKT